MYFEGLSKDSQSLMGNIQKVPTLLKNSSELFFLLNKRLKYNEKKERKTVHYILLISRVLEERDVVRL